MNYTKNIGNKLILDGYKLVSSIGNFEVWENGVTRYVIDNKEKTVMVRDMRVLPCIGHDRMTEIEEGDKFKY